MGTSDLNHKSTYDLNRKSTYDLSHESTSKRLGSTVKNRACKYP